jgi:Phosphodiester glycosidase/FlgD Ig-like domain
MLRRFSTLVLLAAVVAAPAHAQGTQLLPGVTYEKTVEFTPHGAVVLHVLTGPRPGDQDGLYQLAPVLGRGTVLGGREKVTQIEKDVSAQATVAGINGDLFSATDGHPAGIFMTGGVLAHPPLGSRSSIGVDSTGGLHVDRVKFFGTWRGTGQRRPLAGLNQVPAQGQVVLLTPAFGPKAPALASSAEIVLQSFPAAAANVDMVATVTAAGANGGEPIPPGGAIIHATGSAAAKLQAEAPVGTQIAARLILQPAWSNVVAALGGGPVLVRNSAPVFRSLEDFTNDQVAARSPRAGVGQLADGRIILVAVDGDQPGYSVGLTSFELAQTMVRLGAVTAAGVASGPDVSVAFDGQLLNRPSAAGGERAVKEALLVQYFGVYAPPLTLPLLTGEPGKTQEQLSYKLVRPSLVTAQLVGPDNQPRVLEASVQHNPGSYAFTYSSFDVEGTWHWNVTATDDTKRISTIDRTFRYDTTLRGLTAPKPARGMAAIRFTLSRPASVRLRIETANGVLVREVPPVSLPAGAQSVVWDGRLPHGTRAYGGNYVAHVFVTSSVGTSDLSLPFSFRRAG